MAATAALAHSRRRTTTTTTMMTTWTRWKKRMVAPGGEEEWRHGNSGLAFNVPCGVTAQGYPREADAQSGFKEGPVGTRARACLCEDPSSPLDRLPRAR